MTSEQMLHRPLAIIAERGAAYGDFGEAASVIAERWSITLGHQSPRPGRALHDRSQAYRLAHDPTHHDSALDMIGYAALMPEVSP